MEHISNMKMLDLLGGYVNEPEKQRLLKHISQCDDCQKRWDESGLTWNELSALDIDISAKDLFPKIMDEINSNRGNERILPIRTFMRVAASVLLAVIIGHISGRVSARTTDEDLALVIAQANYLDVLAPGSSTGWGEPALHNGPPDSEQKP